LNPWGKMEFVKVDSPEIFFSKEKEILDKTIESVRDAFASPMDSQDVYNHLIHSQEVYLVFENDSLIGMGGYSQRTFSGIPVLTIDGIAIRESFQGKGVFGRLTDRVLEKERLLCLRTQNPYMYRALQNKCRAIFPSREVETPPVIRLVRNEYADSLNCVPDKNGVVKGCYGKSLYGKIKSHPDVSPFFQELNLDVSSGDGLLVVGVR